MEEKFAKPCAGAIIEKVEDGVTYILVQTREKEDGGDTNGLFEIPAGKIREYENIYDTLRREVMEETGLTVTKIQGEENAVKSHIGNHTIISFEPYCVTQNLSGVYSIILNTFCCEAEGTLLGQTNETVNIHWIQAAQLKELVNKDESRFFMMHVNALKKYLQKF